MELPIAILLWFSGTSWCLYKWIGRAYTACEAPKASAYGFGVVLDLVGSNFGSDAALLAQTACVPFQLTFGTLGWLYDQIPTANGSTPNATLLSGSTNFSSQQYSLVPTTPTTRSSLALATYLRTAQWYTVNDCVKLLEKQWATMSAKLDWVVDQTPPEVVATVKQYVWVGFVAVAAIASIWRYHKVSHPWHALSLLLAGAGFVGQKRYTNTRFTSHDLATLLLLLVLVDKVFTLLRGNGKDVQVLQTRIIELEDRTNTLEGQLENLQRSLDLLRSEMHGASERADRLASRCLDATPHITHRPSLHGLQLATPAPTAPSEPDPEAHWHDDEESKDALQFVIAAHRTPSSPASTGTSTASDTNKRTRIPRRAKDRGVEKRRAMQGGRGTSSDRARDAREARKARADSLAEEMLA